MWSKNGWIELKGNSYVRKYGGMKPKHLVVNDFMIESKHYCDNFLPYNAQRSEVKSRVIATEEKFKC